MRLVLLSFATARDAFGFSQDEVECSTDDTPLTIVLRIAPHVSREFLRVALDGEFVSWDTPIGTSRELAFLPPVSGG